MLRTVNLVGLEARVICPTLALAGEEEGAGFLEQARAFIANIPATTKALRVFTSAEGAAAHCQVGHFTAMRSAVYDWLDEVFQKAPTRLQTPA